MRTIRNCVFETNSSSMHTLTICEKDAYNNLGKNYFINDDDAVVSLDDMKKHIRELYKNTPDEEIDKLFEVFDEYRKDFKKLYYDYDKVDCWSYGYAPEEIISDMDKDDINVDDFFKKYNDLTVSLKEKAQRLFAYKDLKMYSEQYDCQGLEWYEEYYTTTKGDEIVAFGYYGYPN